MEMEVQYYYQFNCLLYNNNNNNNKLLELLPLLLLDFSTSLKSVEQVGRGVGDFARGVLYRATGGGGGGGGAGR